MWRPTAATMPGPSMKRLRGCRTPDGEYCRPVWKEVWGASPVSSQLQGVGTGATGRGLFLSLGVKEALEAGVPRSVQDLPDREFGSGTDRERELGGQASRGEPTLGRKEHSEAAGSRLRLRPLSNTLVGAQTPTTGVGEGVALQAQTWEGGWLDPWQFAGHRSKASPGSL